MKTLFCSLIGLFFLSCNAQKEAVNKVEAQLFAGELVRVENFPTQLITPRNVDIWLPENYNEKLKYQVLYMHDGQMLFDASNTWNKQEWKVDEVVSQLIENKSIDNIIVVAIWNISEIRHTDLYPLKPLSSLSKDEKELVLTELRNNNFPTDFESKINSDNYLKFIIQDVKPYIDSHFSVYTDAKNTAIMGSSMGGLISMYALCEYPNVFGKAACLSTHWVGFRDFKNTPIPESFFNYMALHLPSPKTHKVYFDYGTATLDASYLNYQSRVDEVLQQKGFTTNTYKNLKFEGADHSEDSWQNRIHIPIEFLFGKK